MQGLTQVVISFLTAPSMSKGHLVVSLAQVRGRLNLVRRFIRLFRFLDTFHTAYSLVYGPQTLTTETYLDVLSHTFNGLYLLLESLTVIEALQIDGLTTWGLEYERVLKIESQRCWFFALAFGAIATSLRLSMTRKELAVQSSRSEIKSKDRDENVDSDEQRKRQLRKTALEKAARVHLRKLVANVLDLPLPGTVIGWIHAEPRTLGLVMMMTSALTGYDVWERCGV